MGEGEIHRLDPVEIFGVELVLPAGLAARLLPEMSGHRVHHRLQHRHHRHLQGPAAGDQQLAQPVVHDGIEDEAGILLDAGKGAVHLARRANQRPGMLGDIVILELDQAGAHHAVDGLAGRIRYQMNVKALGHIPCPQRSVDNLPATARLIPDGQSIHPTRSFFASVMQGINPRPGKAESGG